MPRIEKATTMPTTKQPLLVDPHTCPSVVMPILLIDNWLVPMIYALIVIILVLVAASVIINFVRSGGRSV
jgi:hypothetical protein